MNEKVAICIFTKVFKKNTILDKFIKEEANRRLPQSITNPTAKLAEENKIAVMIASEMQTWLVEPDQVIIEKLTEGDAMYLVAKGECKVFITSKNEGMEMYEEEHEEHAAHGLKNKLLSICKPHHEDHINHNVKLLRPGSYFGEISIIFDC